MSGSKGLKMREKKVFFRVIDHTQGGHIGTAELRYWADCESAESAIQFYCDSQNKHAGTAWRLFKIDGYYNDQTNNIEVTA
jgi:hypothetical protein